MELKKWKKDIYSSFSDSADLMTIDFIVDGKDASIIFIDGMSDRDSIESNIMRPLTCAKNMTAPYYPILLETMRLTAPLLEQDFDKIVESVASGDIALKIEGSDEAFMISLRKFPSRSVTEPPTSSVLRGPREGFVEEFKTNLTLIRRRLRNPSFVVRQLTVGKYTKTPVAVCYIDEIVDEKLVDAIMKKIKKINIDGVIDSSYIGKFLEQRPNSIFKQTGSTEKPDIFCAKLLEGRVGIIVDGSPVVLTYPFLTWESFQDSQDYYQNETVSSFARFLRLGGVFIATMLPAFYLAVEQFQYQMLPLKFLITILNATSAIPLTPTLELLTVILIFEVLKEASIRMPRHVGMAVSIVGSLVLGDTAVKAGLLSTPAVLITALSAIGLYCVPDESNTFSILRLLFVIIASVLGLYGIILGLLVMAIYMATIDSFSTSITAPFAPLVPSDMQDGLFESSITAMKQRPHSIRNKNKIRRG